MNQGKPFMEPPQNSSSVHLLYHHQQPQMILRQPRPDKPIIFQHEQPPEQLEWRPPPPPLPFFNVQINPTIHHYSNPSKEPFWENNMYNLENIKIQENLARSNGPELTELEAMYNAGESNSPQEASEAERRRKRKRRRRRKRKKKKMEEELTSMAVFLEALMKQVMDHQDFLHRKFLEVIERMDRERMDREVESRRKEVDKDKREAEERDKERASALSREALINAYIQKITGKAVNSEPRMRPFIGFRNPTTFASN